MSKRDSSVETALAIFYCSNVDVICDWIGFSLRSGIGFRPGQVGTIEEISSPLELYMGYPLFLANLLSLRSPSSSQAPTKSSLNSPTFCNLIYQIWTAGDGKKECHIAVGEGKPCTIVSLMSTVFKAGEVEEHGLLMEYLGRDGFSNFSHCTIRRVLYVYRMIAQQSTTLGMMSLVHTIGMLISILEKSVPHNLTLLKSLMRFRYLKRIMGFFKITVQLSAKMAQSSPVVQASCSGTLRLVELAQSSRSHISRSWADIIAGRFLEVVCHLLNSPLVKGKRVETLFCTSALGALSKYTTFPNVLLEYRRRYPNGLKELRMMNPEADEAWRGSEQNLIERISTLRRLLDADERRIQLHICDNIEVRNWVMCLSI